MIKHKGAQALRQVYGLTGGEDPRLGIVGAIDRGSFGDLSRLVQVALTPTASIMHPNDFNALLNLIAPNVQHIWRNDFRYDSQSSMRLGSIAYEDVRDSRQCPSTVIVNSRSTGLTHPPIPAIGHLGPAADTDVDTSVAFVERASFHIFPNKALAMRSLYETYLSTTHVTRAELIAQQQQSSS